MTSNSQEQKFHEGKISDLVKQQEKFKTAILNAQAQLTAVDKELRGENYIMEGLKIESFHLSKSFQEVKENGQVLQVVLLNHPKNRIFGANNSDDCLSLSYLRTAFGLDSFGDTDLPLKILRAFLAFVILLGMETNSKWVGYWTTPPDKIGVSQWQQLVGEKPGHIPCNNSLKKDQCRKILHHMLELSLVNSPQQGNKGQKRGRSLTPGPRSHSRSRSRSRSRSAKKRRFIADVLAQALLLIQEAQESDDSDSDTEEED